MKWMIYGAYGYSGRLIAEEAVKQGCEPILAGRNWKAVKAVSKELSLESRVFPLDSSREVAKSLDGIDLVIHCAGPFSKTFAPMFQACLDAGVHYLDITGEILVFERVFKKEEAIQKAGIVAMPGVGFDVIPTDCLSYLLKNAMPDATHLELGFKSRGGVSRGTMKTMLEGVVAGGVVRENGELRVVGTAYDVKEVEFRPDQKRLAMTIPWGDVSTAFHSTGIPNIRVYSPTSKQNVRFMKSLSLIKPILAIGAVQGFLQKLVDRLPAGPDEQSREQDQVEIFGQISNSEGKIIKRHLVTPNGYEFTARSAVYMAKRILDANLDPGPYTPSLAFGSEPIEDLHDLVLGEEIKS